MPRRKVVEPALKDWGDVDIALARLCQVEAQKNKVEAMMNKQLENVRERYRPQIEEIVEETKGHAAELEQFAWAHRDEFEPKKTVSRIHGELSFRMSPPAVKKLSRKWTAAATLAAVKQRWRRYLRTKEEVAKDRILGDFAAKRVTAEELAEIGLKVEQAETFGIELKYEQRKPNHEGREVHEGRN